MEIWENVDDLFLDEEIFKNIEGYSDYQVSNLGRIKSFKQRKEGKILNLCKDKDGYFQINLCENGRSKPKLIHRLMFETFNDYKLKKGEVIHHIKENPSSNILDNFQLMTNSEHKRLHTIGINRPGEKSGNHKLTERNVIEIRKLSDEEILTQEEIGKMFGVSQETISLIKNRKLWKHIND